MIATGPRLWPIFPTEEIVHGERCGIFLKMRSGFQLLTKMMWGYFAGADCLTFSWNGQASQRVWNVLKVKCQILLNMEISFLVQIGSRRNDCLARHFSVTNHLEVTSSMERFIVWRIFSIWQKFFVLLSPQNSVRCPRYRHTWIWWILVKTSKCKRFPAGKMDYLSKVPLPQWNAWKRVSFISQPKFLEFLQSATKLLRHCTQIG